ncbi:MAG: hypothetical protein Q9M21_00810 [Mariprofundaceae bacterium]|nr:hypothetical protein [Mariprofundaceae bacterium]
MMSEEVQTEVNDAIWMRHMKRYAIAMCVGIAVLAYIFPQLHAGTSKLILVEALMGGVFTFGGAFGIAVSLFFHLWHKKDPS